MGFRRWQQQGPSGQPYQGEGSVAVGTLGEVAGRRDWSPWIEHTTQAGNATVPMTGEVFTALALGGRMWSRSTQSAPPAVDLGAGPDGAGRRSSAD